MNELSGEYTLVRRMAIEDRRIVRYRNVVPPCGSWLHICSPESARYMANAVGLENVTVDYVTMADMYLLFTEKVAPSCGLVPRSVCVGSWRLQVSLIPAASLNHSCAACSIICHPIIF